MPKRIIRSWIKLFAVLALILGGLSPVWSNGAMASASGAMPMKMTAGMTMDHAMGGGGKFPGKHHHMPCCDDSGCCVAGSCGLETGLPSAVAAMRIALAGDIMTGSAILTGVTFPPSLRPPIAA